MFRGEKRQAFSGTWTLAAVLLAAGCGGEIGGSTADLVSPQSAVTRSEMSEIEAEVTDRNNSECKEAEVDPILDCVDELKGGQFKAHFGYKNDTGSKAKIALGKFNRFVPKPETRGQPTQFEKGVHHDVFAVTFDGKPLAWILAKDQVIASRTSTRCGPPPPLCPPTCDDGNPCTADRCDATTQFKCMHTAVTDGMSCSDGDVCDGAEACKVGVCQKGTPLSCNDNNSCTQDSCDKVSGCQHAPVADGTSCPSAGGCAGPGMCAGGTCNPGSGPSCDDNNPCTADSCGPNGSCIHTPVSDGTSCSDGNACNGAETCSAGTCTAGAAPVCNDNNPCTSDSCAPTAGCVFTPVTDGTSCPSTAGCGSISACQQGMCTPTSGVNCDDGNPCTADSCAADGTCLHSAVSDGTSCSDQNACNGLEVCRAGSCKAGSAVTCTAVDACHLAGTCDPASGQCSKPAAPDGTGCSDGNSCTQADSCQSGACVSGKPVVCTTPDACHSAGACDPTTGICVNPAVSDGTSCSDGNACNGSEVCKAGQCQSGSALSCGTTNPCLAGSCDPKAGCTTSPVADGTVCAAATQCAQASTCQSGQCQAGAGISCDDHNPCTADSCDPSGNCAHTPVANGVSCSDGNACNGSETCQAGSCAAGTPVVCSASDQCHALGTCDPATGACSNPPVADGTTCSDGNSCTTGDACHGGTCSAGTPVICTAADQCHVPGTCDPAVGKCSNPAAPDGSSCNDGNQCTTADACRAGACVGGAAVTCSASDQCHAAGTCDPAQGQCSNPNAADGTACNDSNGCTQTDSCSAGSCVGSNPKSCSASDQCHVAGTCDPASGSCSNPAASDGTSCTDNNGCTVGDTCVAGSCTAGAPLVCKADPGCTPGSCNPTSGICSAETCVATCPKQAWAKGYDTPLVGSVALDAAGSLYVTGGLAGSIDFGNGPVTTHGSSDVYLAKIDPATGSAVWSFNYGDDVDQTGVSLAADKAGHLAVTGTYIGGLAIGGTAPGLTSAVDSIFLAGFNASTGAGLWAKNIDLGGGAILGIATDPTDNGVVVAGFTGSGAAANFGGGALVSGGGKDVVVAKFAGADGTLVWAKEFGGTLDQLANAVAVDSTGRVFVTGQYSGALDFGNGGLPTASSASKRIFVARLDGATGAGQASKSFGTGGQQASQAIALDATGNVVLGGAIVGSTVDFGTGPLVSAGTQDAFVAKLTPDLAGIWAKRYGDATTQKVQGVAVNGSGDVVATGLFQGTMDPLVSAGGFDAFALTLDGATGATNCSASAGDAADQSSARVAVNPVDGSEYLLGTFISGIQWDGATALTGSPTASQTFLVQRK